MKLLLTGAAGMLGQDVAAAASAFGHDVVALSRAQLDVTDPVGVSEVVAAERPDVVLNCAAWTDVDGAETCFGDALAANGAGAGNVAEAAARHGAWIVHVSSDYVFSGLKGEPYLESDVTEPLSAYGRSKLAGERAVAEAAPGRHTVVRSSWLFGAAGACFPATILRLAAERDELTVVVDQIGCPTYTSDLAQALLGLCSHPVPGVVHVAGGGDCSWYEFATAIVEAAGLQCLVKPGRTEDLGRPAPRPAYSVLRSERLAPALPHWRDGLWQYMAARADLAGAR
ncbi:MAG TPA: dTDP-4-dehydrorhamnose reductase [Solirubrobacteraceae bacterium]